METRLHLTADFEPLPVYEPHSSAALPTTQESSRDERSQSLEQVKKVVGIQKEPTGMRFTECDIFRHGKRQPRVLANKIGVADSISVQQSQTGTKHYSSKS